MEAVLSTSDQQRMVSSFLEIAVGQTADTARQFLQATSWRLEDAIQLFYVGFESGSMVPATFALPSEDGAQFKDSNQSESDKDLASRDVRQDDGVDVRAPLPVKREVLYDNQMPYRGTGMGAPSPYGASSVIPFRNFEEEMKRSGVWEEQGSSSSTAAKAQDNLASLYRPPFALMFRGSFEKAKDNARIENKWLLVNMQSTREFSSHMLNRDTWANEALAQTIKANFIFWQIYDDTEEGSKVCTYYKLDSSPAVLLIDPVTGQNMRTWRGMVHPESLLEDLVPFMDGSPADNHVIPSHKRPRESSKAPTPHTDHVPDSDVDEEDELQQALAASLVKFEGIDDGDLKAIDNSVAEKEKTFAYLPLHEEPKCDKALLCRVGVRLPDGRRVQRNFLRSDPVQLLWSFCSSELKEEDGKRRFRLAQAIPGASKSLDYDVQSTFQESGLANSMVSVTWE